MKKLFISKKFTAESDALITLANDIITEWSNQGYDLTLRQLYYQFVAKDLIPNTEKSYNRIGATLTNARLAGLVDWDAITDRTRNSKRIVTHDNPYLFLKDIINNYSQNHWADQDVYIEVWVEKEALAQIVGRAANKYYAPHLACKGYVSASAMYEAGKRFHAAHDAGKELHLIYLGDHDPSGVDMSRDIQDRLDLFLSKPLDCDCPQNDDYYVDYICQYCEEWYVDLNVHRIALNMDQIKKYNPPPNPAKITDSRAKGYISKFGSSSWELDALEPSILNKLICDKIESLIHVNTFKDAIEKEKFYYGRMLEFAEKFKGENHD